MRLIEFITIYLAVAAPVSVAALLHRPARDEQRTRAIARAIVAGLLFPFTIFGYALKQRSDTRSAHAGDAEAHDAKINSAQGALVNTLHDFEDRARATGDHRAKETADAAHALGTQVERYTGLTLALAHAEPAGELDEREMELARVAGRTGDDLLIAGRCVRRRNLSRLREHQAQSRLELLHALAELQDALALFAAPRTSQHAHDAHRAPASASAQRLAVALLRVYERAFSLFMLLEDERGVQTVTRLLDATRSRLYRHHETSDAPHAARPAGDAPCKPHSPQIISTPHAPQTLPTPLSARG
ncbi:MAG: hypothetical protein QOE33_3283 [Acidobacteriota bacterium]|nr:hypothetical protein [Acidobacteriota bacterium]